MIVFLIVAALWAGYASQPLPDHPALFRRSVAASAPTTPGLIALAPSQANGQHSGAHHHAQRGDGGPQGWQERRFHGLD